MGIAGQEPAAVGLLAVYRDSMTGELRRFPAGARCHQQCVPAPRVRDFADDYDLFQLAAATDPNLLMGETLLHCTRDCSWSGRTRKYGRR
jgi:hypothetical protein